MGKVRPLRAERGRQLDSGPESSPLSLNSLLPLWIFLAVLIGAPLVDQIFQRASEARNRIAMNSEPIPEASSEPEPPAAYEGQDEGDGSGLMDSEEDNLEEISPQGTTEGEPVAIEGESPEPPKEPEMNRPPSIEDLSLLGQERLLTDAEIDSLPAGDFPLLRNAFYARVGYKFSSSKPHPSGGTVGEHYTRYFSQFDWYSPSISDQQAAFSRFTPSARQNVERLAALEGL